MSGIEARVRGAAEMRAAERREAVADAARAVPGVSARVEDDAVVVDGRDLVARWVEDVRLRYLWRMTP